MFLLFVLIMESMTACRLISSSVLGGSLLCTKKVMLTARSEGVCEFGLLAPTGQIIVSDTCIIAIPICWENLFAIIALFSRLQRMRAREKGKSNLTMLKSIRSTLDAII